MDEPQSSYMGPERREENAKLDLALAEVQRLNTAASTLATAVTGTAHRAELESLQAEVKREFQFKLIFQACMTAVAIIVLILYMQVKFSRMSGAIDRGHQVINCLQGKTEVQRTGDFATTALVTCEQTTR